MITILGNTIGAAWPLFLAAIPIMGALLIYLFRSKGIANQKTTSTLFLLSKLPQYLPSRKRFLPPIQFWLELLACVLLTLSASGLFARGNSNRIAVVIDNSKSMSALQGSGQTRLETAKRIAAADITQSTADATFAIFSSASGANSLREENAPSASPNFISSHAATAQLDSISQSYSADRLSGEVSSLIASDRFDYVWVYSDKSLSGEEVNSRLRVVTVPSDLAALGNIWIDSVSTSQTEPGVAEHSSLSVQVGSVGQGSVAIQLTAECTDPASKRTFSLPPKTISPQSITSTPVQLGPITRSWSYCLVKVASTTAGAKDAITLDNEAWVDHSTIKNEVAFIGSLTPQDVGLTDLPYQIVSGNPTTASNSTTPAIYHRVTPTSSSQTTKTAIALPSAPSLLIFPPRDTELWGNGRINSSELNNVQITRWDASHPLLRYVNPTLITIPKAVTLVCPNSSKPVLYTTTGPIVCAGEEAGMRYVITGFELLPFDGLRSATISIFTLNTLHWLFNASAQSDVLNAANAQLTTARTSPHGLRVGSIIFPANTASARIIAPLERPLLEGSNKQTVITEPGVLSVISQSATPSAPEIFAVNAFSSEESDISQQRFLIVASTPNKQGGAGTPPSISQTSAREELPLESWLTATLLVVLLADLARRLISRARWGATT